MSKRKSFKEFEIEQIQDFLAGVVTDEETQKKRKFTRVWWGESSFENKDAIKTLCRGNVGRYERSAAAWNPDKKLWGAHRLEAVLALLNSKLWVPECFPSNLIEEAKRQIREIVEAEEALMEDDDDSANEEWGPSSQTQCLPVLHGGTAACVAFGTPPLMRECPECHVTPLLQFLECYCKKEPMEWKICEGCDVSYHEIKLPSCLC